MCFLSFVFGVFVGMATLIILDQKVGNQGPESVDDTLDWD